MIGTWQVGTYRRVGHHVASERSIVREASAADGAVVRLAGKFQPTPGNAGGSPARRSYTGDR